MRLIDFWRGDRAHVTLGINGGCEWGKMIHHWLENPPPRGCGLVEGFSALTVWRVRYQGVERASFNPPKRGGGSERREKI